MIGELGRLKKETAERVRDKAVGYLQKGWIQGNYARDQEGNSAHPWSAEACSWCLLGSIERAFCDMDLASGYLQDFYDHWHMDNPTDVGMASGTTPMAAPKRRPSKACWPWNLKRTICSSSTDTIGINERGEVFWLHGRQTSSRRRCVQTQANLGRRWLIGNSF